MANNSWNPSDKSANIGLSGSNLRIIPTTSSDGGVRGIGGLNAGKIYFEIHCTSSAGGNSGVGVASALASLTTFGNNAANGLCYFNSGSYWRNGGSLGSLGVGLNTIVACFAINFDLALAWIRPNGGNWNASGTANPATNTGGIDISSFFTPGVTLLYPIAVANSTGVDYTANFGDTSFAQSVPSGYTSGWPISAPPAPDLEASFDDGSEFTAQLFGLPHEAWSESDKTSGVTLTDSKRTATASASNNGVRGSLGKSQGKRYLEYKNIAISSGSGFGLASLSHVLDGSGSFNSSDDAAMRTTSSITVNQSIFVGSLPDPSGGVMQVAADLDNKLVWFAIDDGDWNDDPTANPDTGVGGITLTQNGWVWSTLYPFANLDNAGATGTLNIDGPFDMTKPSTYEAWSTPELFDLAVAFDDEASLVATPDIEGAVEPVDLAASFEDESLFEANFFTSDALHVSFVDESEMLIQIGDHRTPAPPVQSIVVYVGI